MMVSPGRRSPQHASAASYGQDLAAVHRSPFGRMDGCAAGGYQAAMTALRSEQGFSLQAPGRKAVGIWLLAVAGLIVAMIVVGGLTRLTGSGLSITEWNPIIGALPPLSDLAWADAFARYRQIPQYQHLNAGMTLDAFKG